METVVFITTERGTDLIASFAVSDPRNPGEIESLTLLRTPKYESELDPEERGVGVSFERFPDDAERDLLKEFHFLANEQQVRIKTQRRTYVLDVWKVDADELAEMRKVLREMNRDRSFRCIGV